MKIVADENIPLLKGVFEPYAQVTYKAGNAIDATAVKDADALLIRTRTYCDETLLKNTSVRFIGTATVGTDHIDTDYCRQRHIAVSSAAGSNAAAVMQYVTGALAAIEQLSGQPLAGRVLGIVGAGNIGRLVNKAAQALGMQTLLNDPPRAEREGPEAFVSLDYLLRESDVVTLHIPLTAETENLADNYFFNRLKPGGAFINSSRGEVVDEKALLQHRGKISRIVLDVWRNEPHIAIDVLKATTIATPHIAGYSIQGKRNASTSIIRALANHFHIDPLRHYAPILTEEKINRSLPGGPEQLTTLISSIYPIFEDDKIWREQPQHFEQIRNRYALRNDYSAYAIATTDKKMQQILQQIGFLFT